MSPLAALNPTLWQPHELYCYTDQLSYQAGDPIHVHVSTSAPFYSLEVTRVGAQREQVLRMSGLPGVYHETPANAAEAGCGWPVAVTLTVPVAWRSGYYRLLLRSEDGGNPAEWEHGFVVRAAHPGRDATILLQLATNTYMAYNMWGGASLYDGPQGPLVRVSNQRPFQPGLLTRPQGAPRMARSERPSIGFAGAVASPGRDWGRATSMSRRWILSAGYGGWEYPFVAWAERNGYRLDFATNADLEHHPEVVEGYQLVLSVGHDEYWSWAMRDTLEQFVAGGGNAAFFSGNTCFWQVRFEDEGRSMVCYKYRAAEDPVVGTAQEKTLSSMWADALVGRPESQLTGVSFTRGGYARFGGAAPRGAGGYTVWRPEHWLFDGTGLEYGDLFGAEQTIVGYECDGCELTLEDGLPVPTHGDGCPASFTVLASAPATLTERMGPYGDDGYLGDEDLVFCAERIYGSASDEHKRKLAHGNAVLGVYSAGGTVFTSGCTEWAHGLAGGNPFVERITRNVLDRLARA